MNSLQLTDLRITIIGLGNLAWNLIPNLQAIGHVQQIIGRSNVDAFRETYQIPFAAKSLGELHPETNLVFLTVGDQAIPSVASTLASLSRTDCLFVHCSGSTPLSSLADLGAHIGVLYPFQTFTRQQLRSFREVPLFIEGNSHVLATLRALADALSEQVHQLDSLGRRQLHLAGVLSCNFTNLLYRLSEDLIQKDSTMDFQVFEPLVRTHIENVFSAGPRFSQTGPAIRRDERTLALHMDLLKDQPRIQLLYQLMTELIQDD
ncbi:MAG: DUF2520 domain-containing protein [Bacteroidota bacterium]